MAAPAIRNYIATAAKAGTPGVNPQTYDVTLPTYVAGDLVVVHLLINAGDVNHPGTPTGWTLQDAWRVSGSGASVQTATFTRIMDGSEGTTVHFAQPVFLAYNWRGVVSSW